ncbi:hypothetical protein GBAR_LOCUS29053, partial [Geodia barretti]
GFSTFVLYSNIPRKSLCKLQALHTKLKLQGERLCGIQWCHTVKQVITPFPGLRTTIHHTPVRPPDTQ